MVYSTPQQLCKSVFHLFLSIFLWILYRVTLKPWNALTYTIMTLLNMNTKHLKINVLGIKTFSHHFSFSACEKKSYRNCQISSMSGMPTNTITKKQTLICQLVWGNHYHKRQLDSPLIVLQELAKLFQAIIKVAMKHWTQKRNYDTKACWGHWTEFFSIHWSWGPLLRDFCNS